MSKHTKDPAAHCSPTIFHMTLMHHGLLATRFFKLVLFAQVFLTNPQIIGVSSALRQTKTVIFSGLVACFLKVFFWKSDSLQNTVQLIEIAEFYG